MDAPEKQHMLQLILQEQVQTAGVNIATGRSHGFPLDEAKNVYLQRLLRNFALSFRCTPTVSLAAIANGALERLPSPKFPNNTTYMRIYSVSQNIVRVVLNDILLQAAHQFIDSPAFSSAVSEHDSDEDVDTTLSPIDEVMEFISKEREEILHSCMEALGVLRMHASQKS